MPDEKQNRNCLPGNYMYLARYKKKTTEIVEKIVHFSSPHATDY